MRVLSRAGAALLVLALGGCKGAQLNAPPTSTISLSATPAAIPEHGGASTVRAVVRLPNNELVPDGVNVFFFTTLGTIDASATTRGGVATAVLRSTGVAGTAVVTAISGAAPNASVEVTIGIEPAQALVSFQPSSLPAGGGKAAVRVAIQDRGGNPVPGRAVTLTATSPGKLASNGAALTADSQGVATDSIETTSATTVTATVANSSVTGQATLAVGSSAAAGLNVFATPPDLPSAGGNATITAYATDAGGGPAPGIAVRFETNAGTVSPGEATTDGQGFARSTLSTTTSAIVTVTAESLTRTVRVSVGGAAGSTWTITLASARTTVTDATPSGIFACDPAAGNPQLPFEIVALVSDSEARPIPNIAVTLVVEDQSSDEYDGRGGFCPSATAASEECCPPAVTCPPPLPAPTPSPYPDACCRTSTLPRSATAVTAADGRARFLFTIEDTDLCLCVHRDHLCTARILSSASLTTSVNDLVISFAP